MSGNNINRTQGIITIIQDEIRLDSGIDEAAFGKIRFDSIVTQQGILATMDSGTDENIHFSFDKWTFEDVRAYDVNTASAENSSAGTSFSDTAGATQSARVFYCGKNVFSEKAAPLTHFFNGSRNSDERFYAGLFVCSVMTQAAKDSIKLPQNGAEGIIVDLEQKKVLFLPEDLFKYAANGCNNSDSAQYHRNWVNQTLDSLPGLCFERGVIAYKMLTGSFPYTAENPIEHNADILDSKFLPIKMLIPELKPELASAIDRALKLNSNAVLVPGKKKKGKTSEDLTPEADFPLQLLCDSKPLADKALADNENGNALKSQQDVLAFTKRRDSQINRKRFLRRNKTKLLFIAAGIITLTIIGINSFKTHGEEYTSKGLSSEQTITAFFRGINTKDIPLMENITLNKKPKQFVNSVSQIYVISKQRQHYNRDNGFVNPARYFIIVNNFSSDKKTGIYGTTELLIDGQKPDPNIPLMQKNMHPAAVTGKDGNPIAKDTEARHSVEFYLFHSEGTETDDNGIIVEKFTGEFTLSFKNDKWMITDINATQIPQYFDSYKFKQEYFKAVQECDGDTVQASQKLKDKYEWVPEKADIELERELMIQEVEDEYSYVNLLMEQ